MSDTKPKRAAREPARSEAAVEEAIAAATASVIERNIVSEPAPEPVSTIALVQATPAGPACPVPAAPESSQPDKVPEAAAGNAMAQNATAAAENAWTMFAEAQSALARGFEKAA